MTTSDQLNNILFQLMSAPEIFKAVKQDRSLLNPMIEEFSRLDPAVTFLFRVASADTLIGGQEIKKSETVFISSHCINRDPDEFEDPNRPNLFRENLYRHFTYGFGAHHCLGARLARMEIEGVFSFIFSRFLKIELELNHLPVRDHYSLSFSGFKSLPIVVSEA